MGTLEAPDAARTSATVRSGLVTTTSDVICLMSGSSWSERSLASACKNEPAESRARPEPSVLEKASWSRMPSVGSSPSKTTQSSRSWKESFVKKRLLAPHQFREPCTRPTAQGLPSQSESSNGGSDL